MPKFICTYVRWVDATNRVVGRFAMYLVLAMIGILLYSTISRSGFNTPVIWAVELAQFVMAAYYLLGGGFSLQNRAHVRMDVFYERWSPKTRATMDAITSIFLIGYMLMLLYGGFSSTQYALEYDQHNYSSWGPPMAPIKIIMTVGIFLMLLQVIATFFKDIAAARGEDIS